MRLETSDEAQAVLETYKETVQNEVLAESSDFSAVDDALYSKREEVEGTSVEISLKKADTVTT